MRIMGRSNIPDSKRNGVSRQDLTRELLGGRNGIRKHSKLCQSKLELVGWKDKVR